MPYATEPPTIPVHSRSSPTCQAASNGPSTRPKASASQSDSTRQFRVVEIRNDIGVRNSSAALNSGGSEVAR